jgi:Protein of unknown function (DUF98).
MTKIDQIAQAFAQGVKFAENMKLAMDAAKGKDDEDGHWMTVGEGEEARHVFIKDKKKAAKAESKKAQQRTERTTSQSQPRAQQSTSGKAETVRELKDAYNVSADLIDEMTPKQADRPFLSRLDRIHKDAVALAESAPEITNSHELREMTRIMKNADKLVKALPRYYDRNYYGGWVQKIMGMVRGAEEAYTKLKERKTRGPNAAI